VNAARIVGLGVVALAVIVGSVDAWHAARNFSRMGPLPPGEPLAEFRVAMLDGGEFTSAQLEGRVTVLTFWATWCPACRSELVDLDELDDDFVGSDDVQFLAVNWEGSGVPARARPRIAAGYRDQAGVGLPIAWDDGSMASALRVGPIPHTVVVDRRGTLRHVHQGRVSASTIAYEIEALRDE
jgi:thiol-disulfide isomerase/thioredoxin